MLIRLFYFICCFVVYGNCAYQVPNATCDTTVTSVLTVSNVSYTDATLANVRRVIQPCLDSFSYVNSLAVSNYNTKSICDYLKILLEKTFLKTLVAGYGEIKKMCTTSYLVDICARKTISSCTNPTVKAELQKAVDGETAFRLSYSTGFCKPHSCVLNPLFQTKYEKSDINTCLGTDGLNEVKAAFGLSLDLFRNEGYKAAVPSTIDQVLSATSSQKVVYRAALAHCDLVRTLSSQLCRILKKYQTKTGKQCNIYSKKLLFLLMRSILPPGCLNLGRGPRNHNGETPTTSESVEPTSDDTKDPCASQQESGVDTYRSANRSTIFFGGYRQVADYDDMVEAEPKCGVCNDTRTDGVYFTMLEVDQLKLEVKLTTIPGKIYQYFSGVKVSVLSKTFDVLASLTFENGVDVTGFSNGATEIRTTCDRPITFEKHTDSYGVVSIIKDKCTGLYLRCRYIKYAEGSNVLYFYWCTIRGPTDLVGRQGHGVGDIMTGCFSERDVATGVQGRRKRQTSTTSSSGLTLAQINAYATAQCGAVCGTAITAGNSAVSSDIKEASAADNYMRSVATVCAAQLTLVILVGLLVVLVSGQ